MALVNAAYARAEEGLWVTPCARTDAADTRAAVAAGEVVAAWVDGALVGAVRTRVVDGVGWFGALAVDPARDGQGVGGALVDHVEARAAASGAREMRLELLSPEPALPHTDRLAAWYARRGYEPVETLALAEIDPASVPHLARPCAVRVLRRPLPADGRVAGSRRRG